MNNMSDERTLVQRERPDGERRPDLVCFSHLRWNFVYQRPQHLLARCAKARRVFFFEEPVLGDGPERLEISVTDSRVHVAVPHLPHGLTEEQSVAAQRRFVGHMLERHAIRDYVLWYYTPMALPFTQHLTPAALLYDCMDELSAFKDAPRALRDREAELLRRADVVLTGGHSIYEAKRDRHHNIHPLPSSVDVAHFSRARGAAEPADQAPIPRPRLGFFGVIDERMDIELLSAVAAARPDWQLVLIGPVVKIDPAALPRLPNIHYLGPKTYDELPAYLGGWDVALLPFAKNDSTRFISPTKTPEYLAAGKPVVSTSIRDVVRPYGAMGFVRIADTPSDFIRAIEACLSESQGDKLAEIDQFLGQMSWDRTWSRAEELLNAAVAARRSARKEDTCSTI
jgi:glycosyltransferase involved in cell wall biosynthesis